MTGTFFGHRHTPPAVYPLLRQTIAQLAARGVLQFYVGHNGDFDAMALRALREEAVQTPALRYAVVLAYVPGPRREDVGYRPEETLLPEGQELALPRFAIARRNQWMLKQADVVVSYAAGSGGAARYAELARQKGLWVIDLQSPFGAT